MIKVDTSEFGVAGGCWESERQVRFSSRQGVDLKVDGEPIGKQSEYLHSGGLVVWMGNDDLELVRGAGRVRRRYLDFLGCQLDPLYRHHMNRYQRVLKMRNLLLKDRVFREQELAAYSELFIRHGEFLTHARRRLVEMLSPEVAVSQKAVSACQEGVALEYVAGAGDDLAVSLEMTRDRERRLGQTVVGPHRDEVKLTINGMVAADFASEGQQRTLALALKLAQGELLLKQTGAVPIYLLDDIFGELDPTRRNALMAALPEKAQKLITTTHVDWMEDGLDTIEIGAGGVLNR
jgi:DNA replication and repair protein RecF